ncbi:MAG TPA: restriction endonuclease subunit S [Chlorobaculum sp.]|nr:restriction endonuclease subunit S [Chlorobaculum sp.]
MLLRVVLREIASVQTGYSFRVRLESASSGNVVVIQMKDLRDDHTVDCSDLVRVNMKELKEHHFVRKGDLVLRTRGLVTTSAILLEAPEHAVVSAPLLRIRISRPDKVLPEYLNWYIGQREAQIFLNSRANTTAQKMIGKEAIDDLEVILPGIERQKCIVEIASLSAREQCLLQELAEKRGQYSSIVLMRLAKGEQE